MRIGVDYYPEWDQESQWESDAGRMREYGISIVRVAEFAWSRLEPEEDRFEFGWLDRSLDVMHRHGIQVVLGTPTCVPPPWLMEKYPDAYLRDTKLQPRFEGVRGHRCVNSPSFRKRTVALVERMAEHYADHPAVIGWQTDNEFEMTLCCCDSCESGFRHWVEKKYGTLEALNEAWGTVVWSGEYNSWSQVHTLRGGQAQLNPSLQLDVHRFQNESIADYQSIQVGILREACPHHFITHNLWESSLPIDYRRLFEPLDLVSVDYYITSSRDRLPTSPYSGAFLLDQARGLKRDNFWVMETLSSAAGGACWGPASRTSPPGFIRAVVWQCISRGADAIVHFLWRGARGGAEQLIPGLVYHSGEPPARQIQEFVQTSGEVSRLSEKLDGTVLRHEAAILYSTEQHRAFQIQPQIQGGFDYDRTLKLYHGALLKLGIGSDVLYGTEELMSYKLVVAPYLFLMSEELAAQLEAYAAAGGTLVLTHRSGIKTMSNLMQTIQPPGPIGPAAGVRVEEWDALSGDTVQVRTEWGKRYVCSQWADLLQPVTAKPIGWYDEEFYAGTPAVTVNTVGKGKVYYIGAGFGQDFLKDLFRRISAEEGLTSYDRLPDGVQMSVRYGTDQAYGFLVNFTREEQCVELEHAYPRMLSGEPADRVLLLKPFGVEILEM